MPLPYSSLGQREEVAGQERRMAYQTGSGDGLLPPAGLATGCQGQPKENFEEEALDSKLYQPWEMLEEKGSVEFCLSCLSIHF